MRPKNPRNEARRTVAERFRRYVRFLASRFTVSSEELLRKAEEEQARKAQTLQPDKPVNPPD